MEEEKVILVNEHDEQIGTMPKLEAHEKAVLHRAFSVFVFKYAVENGTSKLFNKSLGCFCLILEILSFSLTKRVFKSPEPSFPSHESLQRLVGEPALA